MDETPLSTCALAARLFEQGFGVGLHQGHVRKILGWSVQRPVWRARERKEVAALAGRRRRWAVMKKSPPTGAHDCL